MMLCVGAWRTRVSSAFFIVLCMVVLMVVLAYFAGICLQSWVVKLYLMFNCRGTRVLCGVLLYLFCC